jgi:hypothetical protein
MANTRAQNATLITTNIPDNNEKLVTPSKVREVENALNNSGVNINGDTFEPDAIFEFDNGSKLREGVIQHDFGGGIARVCANDKTDQWEDGFRYLISTTGSTNTVVYAETINNIIPDDTYDVTDSWAVGSRIKNLVTGIEYICTDDEEDAAVWVPLSDTWVPTLTLAGFDSASNIASQYQIVGNYCLFQCRVEGVNSELVSGGNIDIEPPLGLTAGVTVATVSLRNIGVVALFSDIIVEQASGLIQIRAEFATPTIGAYEFVISGSFLIA